MDGVNASTLAVGISNRSADNNSKRLQPRIPLGGRRQCRQLIQALLDPHQTSAKFILIEPQALEVVPVHQTLWAQGCCDVLGILMSHS